MKISIVTVVYNSRDTIGETITSMREQNYPDKEYIVIDGGSTDGTWDIIKRHREGIQIMISEADKGIYDAMNKGIALATGEVIGILNSGDVYADKTILSSVMHEFKNDQQLDVLYSDLVYVKRFDLNALVRYWSCKGYSADFFEKGEVPPHPTLFVKRKLYKRAGSYNLRYRFAADYDWMLRLFKKHQVRSKYIPVVFVKMRLGGITNNSWKNIILGNIEIYRCWKNNGLKAPLMLMPRRLVKRLRQYI